MKRGGILLSIGVGLFFVLFVLDNAYAIIDLSTADIQILDVQVEPIEILYGSSSDLVKLNLNIQNNGESFFTVRGMGQLGLIETDTTLSESKVRTGNKDYISGNFEYIYSEQLRIKYDDSGIGQDCEKINITVYPNDSKAITICFDLQRGYKSEPFNLEGVKTYFLQLNSHATSGCPYCKIYPLFPSEVPSEDIVKIEQKIPDWVKNTFKWFVEGQISEDEVINAIQFLIKEGIIKI